MPTKTCKLVSDRRDQEQTHAAQDRLKARFVLIAENEIPYKDHLESKENCYRHKPYCYHHALEKKIFERAVKKFLE